MSSLMRIQIYLISPLNRQQTMTWVSEQCWRSASKLRYRFTPFGIRISYLKMCSRTLLSACLMHLSRSYTSTHNTTNTQLCLINIKLIILGFSFIWSSFHFLRALQRNGCSWSGANIRGCAAPFTIIHIEIYIYVDTHTERTSMASKL